MAPRETTPVSGGELINKLHTIANALHADLKQDSPTADFAFETRLHNLILMLKRFDYEMKREG